jgi:hypothetical protein
MTSLCGKFSRQPAAIARHFRKYVGQHHLFYESDIAGYAAALRKNLSVFLDPAPSFFDRAVVLREQRLRDTRENQRLHDLDRARNEASEAFRAKNYGRVISLLTPFMDILTAADKRKLNFPRNINKDLTIRSSIS